jgi:NitT/TauT family transport system ATP-binding protein
MVELHGLTIRYRIPGGMVPAVSGVSASFPVNGISAIVGPSGCGKTSLVHAMAGLLASEEGDILINGDAVDGVRHGTSVIFQDFGLLPWRTVVGNAELGLAIQGLPKARRRALVAPVLDELGLAAFARFYPGQLSGGMKQRVALARALSSQPDLLLMDEPFSSLDALTRESAQEFLLELRRTRPMTIIVVTHSIEEAVYLAETAFVMTGRNPGTISHRFDIPENSAERRFGDSSHGITETLFRRSSVPPGSVPSTPDFRSQARFLELCRLVRAALRGSSTATENAGSARQPGSLLEDTHRDRRSDRGSR